MKPETMVIIVDDSEISREIMKYYLLEHKIENVIEFENGLQLLHYVNSLVTLPESAVPDLIFLDVNMPIMDGLAFLEAYEREVHHDLLEHATVVMHSSSHDLNEREEALSYDIVDEFIAKGPNGNEQLDLYIKELLNLRNKSISI